MQAIRTRYIRAFGSRGNRIQVKAEVATRYVECDDDLSQEQNHLEAAKAFATEFKWTYGEYIGGQFGGDYFWCIADVRRMSPRFTATVLPEGK